MTQSEDPTLSPPVRDALEHEHHAIDDGIETWRNHAATPETVGALNTAIATLREHIYLEETHLFPPLRANGMMAPLLVMVREHGELWKVCDTLAAQVAETPDSEDAHTTGRKLLSLLERHNDKEEPIIYTEAQRVLDEATLKTLAELIGTESMPRGWVCQQAR